MSVSPTAVAAAAATRRAILVGLLIPVGCSGEPASVGPTTAPPLSAAAGVNAELPPKARNVVDPLGAAHWVPADAGGFSNLVGVGALLDDLGDHPATQALLELPMVHSALMQLERSPLAGELARARKRSPVLDQAIDVLLDGFGTEAFLWVGAEAADFARAIGHVYGCAIIGELSTAFGGNDHEKGARLIATVLEQRDSLRLPPITLGLKLTSAERGRRFVTELALFAEGKLSISLGQLATGGGEYFTATLTPNEVPGWTRMARDWLRQLSVPTPMVDRFLEFVASQTIVVAVGLRGDYLVVSVGESADHLAKPGRSPSLADSAELEPLRRRLHADLLSMTYVSPSMNIGGNLPIDDIVGLLRRFPSAPGVETRPDAFGRLQNDVRDLLEEIGAAAPQPGAYLSATVRNNGLESFTIDPATTSDDTEQPLTILHRAGPAPLAVAARRGPKIAATYDRLAYWSEVTWGHFETLAVPAMSAADRDAFNKFETTCVPLIREFDTITRKHLFPAVDGCQAMFTMDGGGSLPFVPGLPGRISPSFRYPRPALVWEVRDRRQLVTALANYRNAINRFFGRLESVYGLDDVPRVPVPKTQGHAGGTMYWYPMIGHQPPDFRVHAVLTDDTAVLALWPKHSSDLLRSSWKLPRGTVDLGAAASAAWWVDLSGLGALVLGDLEIAVEHMADRRMMSRQEFSMAMTHFQGMAGSLNALGTFFGRTYREEGRVVRHTWLRLQGR